MESEQPPNTYSLAYWAGKCDAEANTAYHGDQHLAEGQGTAYARGWLDGNPQHSADMAKLLASPVDDD